MPTITIFIVPLASTPTCIKAPHYHIALPHDFVDLKLGLQLALQLDWPCLKTGDSIKPKFSFTCTSKEKCKVGMQAF